MLPSLEIPFETVLFEEERSTPDHKAVCFAELAARGYRQVGKHIKKEAYLFQAGSNFIVANLQLSDETPAALGLVVNNTEACLEDLAQRKAIDVFDGGAVGELALHIPAVRDGQGRFIYLIDKHRVQDFYAADFDCSEAA